MAQDMYVLFVNVPWALKMKVRFAAHRLGINVN